MQKKRGILTSLKQRTVSAVLWSFTEHTAGLGITFLVGIVLARVLSPTEFGLIGMITVFITLSATFINSGFGNALIRKIDCSQRDYSTVFFFNLIAGALFYLLLFISAPYISNYFKEPILTNLLRVLALVLVIESFSLIQSTILTKRVDFRLQTRVSVISNICSGVVAILMAFNGYGVWSLVVMQLLSRTLSTSMLWLWNGWRPQWLFSMASFRELFGFGGKLLLSNLIDTIYRNIHYLIIGKYFNAVQLGYYSVADQFNRVPSTSITTVMSRVTFPVLAQMQEDKAKLKEGYKRMIKSTMFITFLTMTGIAVVADSLIISLIGEKWQQSVIYLRLLCFVGMLYPLHALNLNMLQVQGRSDLFLKLEVIKKVLSIPVIVTAVFFGIKAMILGMWVSGIFAVYLNSYWSGRLVGYPIKEQIRDILPSLSVAIAMALVVSLFGLIDMPHPLVKLVSQTLLGVVISITISELFRVAPYLELKEIVTSRLKTFFYVRK